MGRQALAGELPTISSLLCRQTVFSSWVVLLLAGRFSFFFIPCLIDCAVLLLKTCRVSPALHPKVPTIRHNPALTWTKLGHVKDGGNKYETSDKTLITLNGVRAKKILTCYSECKSASIFRRQTSGGKNCFAQGVQDTQVICVARLHSVHVNQGVSSSSGFRC